MDVSVKHIKKEYKRNSKFYQKDNKFLRMLNTDLQDANFILNDTNLVNEKHIACIENKMKLLSDENVALQKKSERKENSLGSKIYIGMIMCWTNMAFMNYHNIIENESFMVMNLCIWITSIIVSFM